MRNLALSIAVLVSCGPSSATIKAAEQSRYRGEAATLFAAVKQVTESDYKTAAVDESALVIRTESRWYTPEGQVDTTTGNNVARLQDMSVNFGVVVRLVKADADTYTVTVEPVATRKQGLSSKPEPLDMNDPTAPGWIRGKVESLQVAIYDKLKSYAAAGGASTTPAVVPPAPPAAPPAPPPAEPAPAPAP
jgi:hypothetical protein